MSSNHNDTIHLGNYEAFFILYMDNELSPEQVKMVDAFLLLHPDLQEELDMLMSTRLPMEEYTMSKADLYSNAMKLEGVDENLLLYLDNELPSEKKKIVELELKANKDYDAQLQLLLQTKLDASEKTVYPNKEELYRYEERRRILPAPWMRIAAALLLVAACTFLYIHKPGKPSVAGPEIAGNHPQKGNNPSGGSKLTSPGGTEQATAPSTTVPLTAAGDRASTLPSTLQLNEEKENMAIHHSGKELRRQTEKQMPSPLQEKKPEELVAYQVPEPAPENPLHERSATVQTSIDTRVTTAVIGGTPELSSSEVLNNSPVTSALNSRTTDIAAQKPEKGTVKGFLRKATRLFEKKTGIDPTNEDGELLIGAVAVKLR